jgi:YgiT-type zinc finger domain-containing protein
MKATDKPATEEPREPEAETLCSECSAGMMHLHYITYFTWLNDELIIVPNFPAWICDVCGKRSFDPRAITWLNALLNPSAGGAHTRRAQRRQRPSSLDRPQP